jgi:hypothetical protein
MNQTKRAYDVKLPGNGIYWIIGSIFAVTAILGVTGAIISRSPSDPSAYEAPKSDTAITSDKMQSAVRAMADFMVEDDNVIGLRMWARSLGISAPDFASAATLRENISRNTNDFSIYRNKEELARLVELLGNQDMILNEVVR